MVIFMFQALLLREEKPQIPTEKFITFLHYSKTVFQLQRLYIAEDDSKYRPLY